MTKGTEAPHTQPILRINGAPHPLRSRILRDLLRDLGHDPDRPGIAVALNGEVVPREEWGSRTLAPGDAIDIVGAVQGG